MPNINKEELLKLASLSKISLSDDEIISFTEDLNRIRTFFLTLKDLDTDDLISDENRKNMNHLRKDQIEKTENKEQLLKLGDVKNNFFTVPNVIKK